MLGVVLCVILFRSTLCSNCSYWKIASTNTESVTSFQCSGLTEPVALTVSVERKTLFCNDTTRNESKVERLILAPAPLVCASATRLSCYGDCSKVWKTVQLLCNWTEKSLVEIKCTFSYVAKKCDLATWETGYQFGIAAKQATILESGNVWIATTNLFITRIAEGLTRRIYSVAFL